MARGIPIRALPSGTVGRQATSRAAKRPGTPVDPWWVLGMVRRGWRILAGALGAGLLAGGLVATLAIPSTYESTALIVADVDPDPANPWAAQEALDEGVELIEHESTMIALRERLDLDEPLASLERRIDAEVDPEARVIRVAARSASASGAAALAGGMVDTFLDQRRENERARLLERARLARSELAAAQAQLADARREYDAFRQEHGIADLDEEQERAIAEAARLSAEADEEQVAAVSAGARMDVLRREARRLPRMQTATASSTDLVQNELATARAELAQARARYTADHPALQGLVARVESLERERRRGGRRAVQTDATSAVNPVRQDLEGTMAIAAADRATAIERQEGLRRLAEQARARVAALTELEGQASLLLAAVNVGETQVRELRRTIAESEDRAGDPQPGYHVAAAASTPERALPSKERKLAWALPPLIALALAFGVLFFRERGGPRVQTASEIAWWGGAPVIGTTTWPADPRALDALVAELEDLGTYAAGRTLVVPATAEERELADEFAGRLGDAPWLAAEAAEPEGDATPTDPVLPRSAGGRPTLPMPIVVTPAVHVEGALASGVGEDVTVAAGAGGVESRSGRVRQAKVELVAADDARAGGADSEPHDTREAGEGTVRVGSTVYVGADHPPAGPGPTPRMDAASERGFRASGTLDDARAPAIPFEIRAAQDRSDSVLMLAMRILRDAGGEVDARALRPTVIEPRPPLHRAVDPGESRAAREAAVALAWNGVIEGPALRRAVRLADRVIVVVREGSMTAAELAQLRVRLGREEGIGFLVVGAGEEETMRGRDRVGQVADFWTARKRLPG